MMSGSAYFVGRKELLEWVNALCGSELTRVEQTCSGAIACQVLDALYPGCVPMSKVDWGATHDYEFVHNYKLLQKCFNTLEIDKQIPVDRLVRGKYQDNLEFLQWLKAFYDSHGLQAAYDPIARREKGKGGAQYNRKLGGLTAARAHSSTPAKSIRAATPTKKSPRSSSRAALPSISDDTSTALKEMVKNVKAENESLSDQSRQLREALGIVERDRDFYYKKMEAIEKLVNDLELSKTAGQETTMQALAIRDVLYASEDEQQASPQ